MKTTLIALCVVAALAGCKSDDDKAAEAAAQQSIQKRAMEAATALCAGDVDTFASSYMTEEAGNDFGKAVAEAFDDGYKDAHPILGRAAGAMSQKRKLQLIKGHVAKTGAVICTLESVQLESFSGDKAKVSLNVKVKTASKTLTTKWEASTSTWLIAEAGDIQKQAVERVRVAASKS